MGLLQRPHFLAAAIASALQQLGMRGVLITGAGISPWNERSMAAFSTSGTAYACWHVMCSGK